MEKDTKSKFLGQVGSQQSLLSSNLCVDFLYPLAVQRYPESSNFSNRIVSSFIDKRRKHFICVTNNFKGLQIV